MTLKFMTTKQINKVKIVDYEDFLLFLYVVQLHSTPFYKQESFIKTHDEIIRTHWLNFVMEIPYTSCYHFLVHACYLLSI